MFFSDRLSEFKLVQNDAFGATILWIAIAEYFKTTCKVRGMPLPMAMLILPLCYHRRSAEAIASCNSTSGFYMALAKDRTLPAGLQERLEDMVEQSFAAIRLAAAAKLLRVDKGDESLDLVPTRASLPNGIVFQHSDIKTMERSAKRLGRWIAETPLSTTCSLLRVRF